MLKHRLICSINIIILHQLFIFWEFSKSKKKQAKSEIFMNELNIINDFVLTKMLPQDFNNYSHCYYYYYISIIISVVYKKSSLAYAVSAHLRNYLRRSQGSPRGKDICHFKMAPREGWREIDTELAAAGRTEIINRGREKGKTPLERMVDR